MLHPTRKGAAVSYGSLSPRLGRPRLGTTVAMAQDLALLTVFCTLCVDL